MINRWFLVFCLPVAAGSAVGQTVGFVAGLHPDWRPDEAVQLAQSTLAPEQLERALHGIDRPVSGNVELIAATGRWWVPLRRPGMTPPYDLRGWHSHSADTAVTGSTAPLSR
ncbi:MAG: hypothetical protein FWF12_01125 [Betaproteobacteria bacterium]|nr:hypothetical protein [Betaproteobacteria bacterium]